MAEYLEQTGSDTFLLTDWDGDDELIFNRARLEALEHVTKRQQSRVDLPYSYGSYLCIEYDSLDDCVWVRQRPITAGQAAIVTLLFDDEIVIDQLAQEVRDALALLEQADSLED